MTLLECYNAMEGDYQDMMSRLPKEEMVIKFLRKFENNNDFVQMLQAIQNEKYEDVFQLSHTLKGVCANLSMTALAKSVSEICEQVRHGAPDKDLTPLVENAQRCYEKVIAAIEQL